MNRQTQKDAFFAILAIISFIADLLTLAQFIGSQTFLSFLTFQWFVSIVFVILLAVGGFGFLILSGNEKSAEVMLVIFGAAYTILSLTLYLFFGYKQTLEQVTTGAYFGFLVLFFIVCGVGIFGIAYQHLDYLKYPSYGYASVNLLHTFILINKYVLQGASFKLWQFTGETVILIIGAVIFLNLFMAPER